MYREMVALSSPKRAIRQGETTLVDPQSRSARAVAAAQTAPLLVASYDGGAVMIWDLKTRAALPLLRTSSLTPLGLAVRNSGDMVAVTGSVSGIELFDLHTRKKIGSLAMDAEPSGAIAFSPDGSRLAAIDAHDSLYVWDLDHGGGQLFVKADVVAHEGSQDAPYSPNLAWNGQGRLSVLMGNGVPRVINLDVNAWRKRMDDLQFHGLSHRGAPPMNSANRENSPAGSDRMQPVDATCKRARARRRHAGWVD